MTKRYLLRRIATIFDPLGFFAPVTIVAKMLMQKIWASGAEWDESLNEQLAIKVRAWFQQLLQLTAVRVPHCLRAANLGPVQSI